MPRVDFGPWLPDQEDIGLEPRTVDAKNVVPGAGRYGPLAGLSATTGALDGRCRGAVSARDGDGAAHMYAGDATDLYELASGSTWTNRTRSSGGDYALGTTDRWRFATFGDRLIAVNGVDAPQYIDMSTAATNFAALAGTPGAAKYVAAYGEFVFLGNLAASAFTIKWSAIGDSEGWTPGTGQSDEQEFADGGIITGLVATRGALYVFQEKCIRRVVYVGGDLIMRIDKLIDGIGCIEPNSVASWGQLMFFLSEDGWYMFDGESQPLAFGANKFDDWFLDDSERGYWYNMSAVIDPRRKLFACGYASTGHAGAGLPDSIFFYNYATGGPSYARVDHQILSAAQSTFTSLDDLTDDLDADYSISFDDPYYQGGAFYFGAFTTANKLGTFSGSNLEATLAHSPTAIFDGERASVEWIKPIADTTAATIEGGSQVRPGDSITYQSAVSQQDSGRCPMRSVNGFYLASKLVIPAAASWTWAKGVEFQARRAGLR